MIACTNAKVWCREADEISRLILKEEESARAEVGLLLNLFVAGRAQGNFGITEHRFLMPGYARMDDFMRFVPTPLELRFRGVNQNSLTVRKVEGLQ